MNKVKINIIKKGAGIIHHNGYNNTGVSEILSIAKIPKGSFYFYFKNKEDFGLEVIEYYADQLFRIVDKHTDNIYNSPIENLSNCFEDYYSYLQSLDKYNGCPISNLSQEMSSLNENMRGRLNEINIELRKKIAFFIKEAQSRFSISDKVNVKECASFILNTWAGALIQLKLTKNDLPYKEFKKQMFEDYIGYITVDPSLEIVIENPDKQIVKKKKLSFLRRK